MSPTPDGTSSPPQPPRYVSGTSRSSSVSSTVSLGPHPDPLPPPGPGEIFVISSYTDFSCLAHGPTGKEARFGLYSFWLNPSNGTMTLLSVTGPAKTCKNPSFSRVHPTLNLLYTCTEDIVNPGEILTYKIENNGALTPYCEPVSANGTSTCYLTINNASTHMLACNYWNSSLLTFPLDQSGVVSPHVALYDPHHGKPMKAATKKVRPQELTKRVGHPFTSPFARRTKRLWSRPSCMQGPT